MPRANLNDIQIFMAVADAGSFVAGGRAMGLSRSAAGKAIARLEDRLGTRLVNRTTRALSLTDEGHAFYQSGLEILASVDEAEAGIAGEAGTPRGTLRLTVPGGFGRAAVLPVVGKYLKAWPEMQVEMSFTDRLVDLVEEGFDLAVRIGVTAPDTRLVSRTVATFRAVLCAAPSYLAAKGMPEYPGDLAAHDCLIFTSDNQRQGWRFRGGDGSWFKVQGRSRLRLDHGEAIRDAALAGLGIAFLPDFMIADDLAAGRLEQVLPDLEAAGVPVITLYPSKRLLEPRVRRFIDLMVEELAR